MDSLRRWSIAIGWTGIIVWLLWLEFKGYQGYVRQVGALVMFVVGVFLAFQAFHIVKENFAPTLFFLMLIIAFSWLITAIKIVKFLGITDPHNIPYPIVLMSTIPLTLGVVRRNIWLIAMGGLPVVWYIAVIGILGPLVLLLNVLT